MLKQQTIKISFTFIDSSTIKKVYSQKTVNQKWLKLNDGTNASAKDFLFDGEEKRATTHGLWLWIWLKKWNQTNCHSEYNI